MTEKSCVINNVSMQRLVFFLKQCDEEQRLFDLFRNERKEFRATYEVDVDILSCSDDALPQLGLPYGYIRAFRVPGAVIPLGTQPFTKRLRESFAWSKEQKRQKLFLPIWHTHCLGHGQVDAKAAEAIWDFYDHLKFRFKKDLYGHNQGFLNSMVMSIDKVTGFLTLWLDRENCISAAQYLGHGELLRDTIRALLEERLDLHENVKKVIAHLFKINADRFHDQEASVITPFNPVPGITFGIGNTWHEKVENCGLFDINDGDESYVDRLLLLADVKGIENVGLVISRIGYEEDKNGDNRGHTIDRANYVSNRCSSKIVKKFGEAGKHVLCIPATFNWSDRKTRIHPAFAEMIGQPQWGWKE